MLRHSDGVSMGKEVLMGCLKDLHLLYYRYYYHHHHISVMEFGPFLTRSGLTS